MNLKAAILDWAGTVVDFGSCAPVVAMHAVFEQEGLPVDEGIIRRYMGMAKREHVKAILSEPETAERWRKAKASAWSEHDVERIMMALEPAITEAARSCAVLIPGAADAVSRLRAQGLRIGSTTGYTRAMMGGILDRASEQGYSPDCLVCAGETAQGRPAPLMIWKALVELGVWPAAAAVVVDDAPVGIAAGRHAGCWCIGVAGSGNGVGLAEQAFMQLSQEERRTRMAAVAESFVAVRADFVVASIADLPDAVAKIDAHIAAGRKPGDEAAAIWI